MFFLRRSTIVVDCFINNEQIGELYPIQPTNKFIPSWWKKLPNSISTLNENNIKIPVSTMKYCAGFNNLYSTGIVIPMWTDFFINNSNDNQEYQFADRVTDLTQHDIVQFDDCFKNHFHIKITSPWKLKEKTGVNWIFTELFYNLNNSLDTHRIMPGIVEYKYQSTTNINILIKKADGSRLYFSAGDPMVHLIPLSEKKVKIKTHIISTEEYNKKFNYNPSTFLNTYHKTKKIMQNNEKKCPFGFGK
jgi:hypothetical protein